MYSQWVTSPLLLDCLPQNAFNAEKSYDALLSHVIGELSKVKTVYDVNTEVPSMVSHNSIWGFKTKLPNSVLG